MVKPLINCLSGLLITGLWSLPMVYDSLELNEICFFSVMSIDLMTVIVLKVSGCFAWLSRDEAGKLEFASCWKIKHSLNNTCQVEAVWMLMVVEEGSSQDSLFFTSTPKHWEGCLLMMVNVCCSTSQNGNWSSMHFSYLLSGNLVQLKDGAYFWNVLPASGRSLPM